MSKNFELMRRAGNGFERQRPLQLDVQCRSLPVASALTAAAVENSPSDWLRALAVLQKHWRLSAVLPWPFSLRWFVVTYLTTPDL